MERSRCSSLFSGFATASEHDGQVETLAKVADGGGQVVVASGEFAKLVVGASESALQLGVFGICGGPLAGEGGNLLPSAGRVAGQGEAAQRCALHLGKVEEPWVLGRDQLQG